MTDAEDIDIGHILEGYEKDRRYLIPILQDIQEEFEYISPSAVKDVAAHLQISEHNAYGVATFYAQFRFQKPGKHMIRVCQGTACHVRGGKKILDVVKEVLCIEDGETTEDQLFTLEEVACLGCCALGPVIVVDDKVYGRQSRAKTGEVIEEYRRRAAAEAAAAPPPEPEDDEGGEEDE